VLVSYKKKNNIDFSLRFHSKKTQIKHQWTTLKQEQSKAQCNKQANDTCGGYRATGFALSWL
jgi:hypothetical protein